MQQVVFILQQTSNSQSFLIITTPLHPSVLIFLANFLLHDKLVRKKNYP
jgi:hypothetical protein